MCALHLGCVSAAPRLHLGCTSARTRLQAQCDFAKATGKGLLQGFLLEHDAAAPDPELQPAETAAFIAEVEEVFVANGRILYMIFDYFASLHRAKHAVHR